MSDLSADVTVACSTFEIKGFTPCRSGGLLGDGKTLRVLLMTRGATAVIAELNPTEGSFTRVLDGTSELSMTGTVSGKMGDACCVGWDEVRTWATEILIYRDGRDAWCGPVTDVLFDYGTIQVQADDLTAWWDRRPITSVVFNNQDLTDIFVALNDIAMKPDPSPGIVLSATTTGVRGTRSYNGATYTYVGDAIKELGKTGLDYTAYGRTVIVAGEELRQEPFVTLMDEHWTTPPSVRERGNDQATVVVVKGKGVQAVATASKDYLTYYGYLVRVFDEPSIEDIATLRLAAETRLDMLKDPVYIETPTGAALKTTAPITLEQLIPGIRVRVDSQSTCRQVVADFRLQKVTVGFDGTVSVDLQPIGHMLADDLPTIVSPVSTPSA